MMQPMTAFALAKHAGPYERWPRRTELFVDGAPSGVRIAGYVIDGQYRCAHGTLLIVSWDCPFSETYEFVLLGDRYRSVAKAALAPPHGKYLLHAHWPIDDQRLRLHFYGNLFCTLWVKPPGRLLRRPRLALEYEVAIPSDEQSQNSIAQLECALAAAAQPTPPPSSSPR
jgi:hypothetical protein